MSSPCASFRVATYNVLSPKLCSEGWFPHCEASACTAAGARLQLVLSKLQAETAQGSVVALQEVAREWAGPLHAFFASRGYHFVDSGYGSPFSGHMGVGLAFPTAKFKLEDCLVQRISTTKEGGYKAPKAATSDEAATAVVAVSPVFAALSAVAEYASLAAERLRRAATALLGPARDHQQKEWPPWTDIEWRKQTSIMMRLRVIPESGSGGGPEVCVAVYHMPCAFKTPCVIAAHCSLLAKAVQRFSKDLPYVIAGDFNLQPGSPSYQLLTTGVLPPEDAPRLPGEEFFGSSRLPGPAYEGDTWTLEDGLRPLASAYKESAGSEPSYTNFAFNKMHDKAFRACIDYIFFSKGVNGLEVVDVDAVPQLPGHLKSLPSLQEPSDHVKIAAAFQLRQ